MSKHIEHSETIDRVTYELHIEEEDIPVRGNASALDDEDYNRRYEDKIIQRLDNGDLWAWCYVVVTASIVLGRERFEGQDALGGCCYENVADFIQPGGYWEQMRHQALEDLARNLEGAVERGKTAAEALFHMNLATLVRP